jgi:cysteine synthase
MGSSSGVSTQSTAFITGISGNVQTGATIVVTASGQMGASLIIAALWLEYSFYYLIPPKS